MSPVEGMLQVAANLETEPHLDAAAQAIALHKPPAMPAATVAKITTAICRVMAKVGVIEKQGTNEFFHYRFVQMQDVLQVLTPLMAEAGIAILQTEVKRELDDGGKALAVTYAFTICHSSGEIWPERMMWTGSSIARNRNGTWDDKALNKCATAARKYCLLSLFQVPTGDQDDADRGENDSAGKLAGSVGGQYGLGDPTREINAENARRTSQATYDALRGELSALDESGASPEGLKQWGIEQGERINKLVSEHYDPLRKFFGDVLERSKAKFAEAKVGGLVGPDDPTVREVKAAQEQLSNDQIADLLK